jgi:sulfonate transport system ATP-binding protein
MSAAEMLDPAGERPEVAVRVRGLSRRFEQRTILDGIDLDVRSGEFVALLGASGSGKSTLLRILAGLDTDASGEVELPEARSVVFQDARLLPWKRVWNNVALGLPRVLARTRVDRALGEVALTSHRRAWPATLSGGESQRVALARALVREPALLLLDEPFGALDALTRLKMQGLLLDLWRRHRPAVILVTHDIDEALSLADRVLVLADGRFVADHRLAPRERPSERAGVKRRLLAMLGVTEAALAPHPVHSTSARPEEEKTLSG